MCKRQVEEAETGRGTSDIKSVIFCPYTVRVDLAKQLRQGEEDLKKITGYMLNVVEQLGDKILDKLHTANPWRGRPPIEETAGHVGPRSGLKRMERKTVERDLVYMKHGVRNNDDTLFY